MANPTLPATGIPVRAIDHGGSNDTQVVTIDMNPSGTETLLAGTMPISEPDLSAGPTAITTQNLVPAGTATAASTVALALGAGQGTLTFQVTGSYTGASLQAQVSQDGTNWVTLNGSQALTNVSTGLQSASVPAAAVGVYQVDVSGFTNVRVSANAAMTGTATVTLKASSAMGVVAMDAPVALAPPTEVLPAGATSVSTIYTADVSAYRAISVAFSGTWTATVQFEGSNDNSNWFSIFLSSVTSLGSPSSNTTFNSIYVGSITTRYVRVRVSAYTSGTVATVIELSPWPLSPLTVGGIFANFSSPASLADAFANPSVGHAAGDMFVYNGSTWDRVRANIVSTTGDTGAKTATFNGALQTNNNGHGITALLNLGTVTGTTPTLVAKIQGSLDSGTTWYDIPGAATATIVATGLYGIQVYPGAAAVAAVATAGTICVVNQAVPRYWRVVYTISGTTPSFTLTNVQTATHL